jgi:hypothetical protein
MRGGTIKNNGTEIEYSLDALIRFLASEQTYTTEFHQDKNFLTLWPLVYKTEAALLDSQEVNTLEQLVASGKRLENLQSQKSVLDKLSNQLENYLKFLNESSPSQHITAPNEYIKGSQDNVISSLNAHQTQNAEQYHKHETLLKETKKNIATCTARIAAEDMLSDNLSQELEDNQNKLKKLPAKNVTITKLLQTRIKMETDAPLKLLKADIGFIKENKTELLIATVQNKANNTKCILPFDTEPDLRVIEQFPPEHGQELEVTLCNKPVELRDIWTKTLFKYKNNHETSKTALVNITDSGWSSTNRTLTWNSAMCKNITQNLTKSFGTIFTLGDGMHKLDPAIRDSSLNLLQEKLQNYDFCFVMLNFHSHESPEAPLPLLPLASQTIYYINSCFSGKFLKDLKTQDNVIFISASSSTNKAYIGNYVEQLTKALGDCNLEATSMISCIQKYFKEFNDLEYSLTR